MSPNNATRATDLVYSNPSIPPGALGQHGPPAAGAGISTLCYIDRTRNPNPSSVL